MGTREEDDGAGGAGEGSASSVAARSPRAGFVGGSKRLPGQSAHASVVHEIGFRIVRGDYPPGTILPNEAEWSESFGVSRSVIREAVKTLTAKNLIASRQKIGSWVEPRDVWNLLDRDVLGWYSAAPGNRAFLRTVQEFRAIVEPEAAALAAERRTEEEMAVISQACADMGTATSLSARTAADTRFHLAILKAAKNDLLLPLGATVDSALTHLFMVVTREANDLRHAQDLHEGIEEAIRLQRPEEARKAVHRLLANTDVIIGARGQD